MPIPGTVMEDGRRWEAHEGTPVGLLQCFNTHWVNVENPRVDPYD